MGYKILDKKEVIARYKNGESVSKIAKDNSVSREAVYKVLRKMQGFKRISEKINEKKKKETLNKFSEYHNDIYKLREEGLKIKDISEALEIPTKNIRVALEGTDLDNTYKLKRKRNEKIFKLYKKGVKQRQLADMYNTTQSNISNILQRHYKDRL